MSNSGSRQVDFYFDFISHNAYLAWHLLPGMAAKHGYSVRSVPVLFAGFLKAFGQLGPAEIAPKLAWMNRNNLRKALLLGIPLKPPKQHPFHPLFLLRLSAQAMSESERLHTTTVLLRAIWAEGHDPNDRGATAALLDREGLDGARLVAGADDDAAKRQLKQNTDEAIARGGFGVPTMIVGDEVFWGYDDLTYLELALAGKDPLAASDLEAYLSGWEQARAAGEHR